MRVLAIDPSGNFEEGKGHTGWVLAHIYADILTGFEILEKGTIYAKDFETRTEYWKAVTELYRKAPKYIIVEDYKLYNHKGMKAQTQSHSQMETPRLIGVLEYFAKELKFDFTLQMATEVRMYKEETLIYQGLLKLENKRHLLEVDQVWVSCNEHERMAYKHFLRWFNKKY